MYDYYQNHDYVSNSGLGALDKQLKGAPPLEVTPAMEDGRLLHEAVLEPHKSTEKWLNHPRVVAYRECKPFMAILKVARKEHEIYRTIEVRNPFGGEVMYLRFKAKLDIELKLQFVIEVHDVKFMSNRVVNPKATIQWMNYDRQAYAYMMMSGAERMVYWFDPDCVYVIRKGDALWKSGKAKFEHLAWQAALIRGFKKKN